MENMDFPEAVEKVKLSLGKSDWVETKQRVESTFRPVVESKEYKTLPASAWKKMEDSLAASKEAQDWLLRERGITYATAKKLRFGFAQNIGNLAGKDGADIADKGWVAFACLREETVVSIKYRSLRRKKLGGFSRQPGFATSLFNTNTIDIFSPVYLVVGEFDCAVMEQAGFNTVSMSSDSVKLTPEQKDQLMSASCVILAGDTDPSGIAALQKLWRELSEKTYLLTWEGGAKDANATFLEKCGGDVEKFKVLVEELTTKARMTPMPDVYGLQEVLRTDNHMSLTDHPDRLRFPWPSVDKMVNILPGDILGVGSTNTGMGKSTWTLQVSLHNARKYGKTVLNYQAEMQPNEVATMVAAGILHRDRNFLTSDDKKSAANALGGVQYFIGNNPVLSDINAVLDVIEAGVKRLGADLVILDHFHHFTTGMHNENQVQAAAMTRIKQIAQTYKVIFINVGQPRKATQQTKGKQIHITDFKGSGAWGDAANAAIAIHRDLNKAEDPSELRGVYEDKTLVKVLKARSMGTGASACYLTSFGEFASFEEITTHYEEPPE